MRALIWCAVSSPNQAASDKISLEEQERAARAWCAENGCDVVGVLTVPGESRSENDVLTIYEDFATKGIYAYHDLRRMWQSPRQFDVLVVYHDSRLGRSEALFTYVVSNVMRSGARIYCILGGWYQPEDYKLKLAIGMINVSSEMERFVRLTAAKKHKRAQHGLLVHGKPVWAYQVERDERGQPVKKVPDERYRLVIEAAARLVIDGVGWVSLEKELAARHGLLNGDKPYARYTFYWLFHNPNFYGNEFIARSHGDDRKTRYAGLWVFDPAYPAPEGAQVYYGVMRAYLDDDLGEQLKAEIRRRHHSIRGSARPGHSRKFTGLLSCYYCGRKLVYKPVTGKNIRYWQCSSKYTSTKDDRCTQVRTIREEIVQAWFDRELRAAIKAQDPLWFLRRDDEVSRKLQYDQMTTRRDQLEAQINRAMDEQERAQDDRMRQRWRDRANEHSAELREVEQRINTLETRYSNNTTAARQAFERLQKYPTLEQFWEAGDNIVNQVLHALLGETLIVIRDRKVYGEAERER